MDLIDSGSTNSFMNYDLGLQGGYKLSYGHARKVCVAGGGELQTDTMVDNLKYQVQGENFQNPFQLLQIGKL